MLDFLFELLAEGVVGGWQALRKRKVHRVGVFRNPNGNVLYVQGYGRFNLFRKMFIDPASWDIATEATVVISLERLQGGTWRFEGIEKYWDQELFESPKQLAKTLA